MAKRKKPPGQGVLEAHQARAERDCARPGPLPGVQGDRPLPRPGPVDRRQRGGGAPLRDGASGAAGRGGAGGRGARRRVPEARGLAPLLQRLPPPEGVRLPREAAGLLRRAHGPAGGRRGPVRLQAGPGLHGGGGRVDDRRHQGRPGRAGSPRSRSRARTPAPSRAPPRHAGGSTRATPG